jgi:hypothetical protein
MLSPDKNASPFILVTYIHVTYYIHLSLCSISQASALIINTGALSWLI